MIWLVLGLFGVGRFFEFFVCDDSAGSALGLEAAQWISIALILIAGAGAWVTRNRSVSRTP
jgi:prolipoprotein diacylglyceryltransferase